MSVVNLTSESTPCLFLYFEKHILLLLLLYSNKSRPFAVSNDTLFVSVRSTFLVLFVVIFDPRRLIIVTVIKFQAVLDLVCCNRYLRAVE